MFASIGLSAPRKGGPKPRRTAIARLKASPKPRQSDVRVTRLSAFFRKYDCPVQSLAPVFIRAADAHGLDWRLLPSIAFVESTGGKYFKNNNIFGWDSANKRFRTVADGIHYVAYYLSRSRYYRGKKLDEVLHTYNPAKGYRERVRKVMNEMTVMEPAMAD